MSITGNHAADSFPLWTAISRARVVDLSQPLRPGMPCWPGDPTLEFATVASISRDGYYLRRFALGEHSGTHMNAPSSFHPGGASVDEYPARTLVAPAVVLDLREEAASNADCSLGVPEVLAWEEEHGVIPPGSLALLCTGWQAKWASPDGYLGLDAAGRPHFPGFSPAAARFLVQQRGIAGLGIDTHGVDGGRDAAYLVNRLVLEQPRLVLENLNNLDQLPPVGAVVVVGRLPLLGGSGSPASVLALAP